MQASNGRGTFTQHAWADGEATMLADNAGNDKNNNSNTLVTASPPPWPWAQRDVIKPITWNSNCPHFTTLSSGGPHLLT